MKSRSSYAVVIAVIWGLILVVPLAVALILEATK